MAHSIGDLETKASDFTIAEIAKSKASKAAKEKAALQKSHSRDHKAPAPGEHGHKEGKTHYAGEKSVMIKGTRSREIVSDKKSFGFSKLIGVVAHDREHKRHDKTYVPSTKEEKEHKLKDAKASKPSHTTHDKEKTTPTVSAPKDNTRTSSLVKDKIRDRSQTRRRGLMKSTIPGWNLTG